LTGKVEEVHENYITLNITKGVCKGARKIYYSEDDYISDVIKHENLVGKNITLMVNSNVCKKEMEVQNNLSQ
jgi:hypothetical protein